MTIAAVGLGLIGGSLMIDLRKRGFADKIIGVDSNLQHRNIAQLCGLVDETDTLDNAVDRSDLIILSTPVDTNCEMLPEILDRIVGTSKVVTDMGSTKGEIAKISEHHPGRGRYVALHPMAGTEFSGPLAAIGRLFDYKNVIICDPELSDKDALGTVEKMVDILNMRKVYMNSSDHDVHVAYVSHISHITSFSLALSVLDKEREEQNILTLAGGGFESTVRLAKSNGDTWAPIFLENSRFIIEVIDNYIEKMNLFRKMISEKDKDGLKALMEEANKIRKILN
ncbi:MAG: prephenate dehydrogenase [Bacteroidetes bacterium RBG_19FT_COMBO_42_7]|nr:MAG: prephenate dehydrogenase [Bacteroidetes bacterium RBG_13_42_15]OFY81571.1 MAG: prephenate dehydrogenase [Bacteroidetes bacterium RBG_19FT_COMBO_42_7]